MSNTDNSDPRHMVPFTWWPEENNDLLGEPTAPTRPERTLPEQGVQKFKLPKIRATRIIGSDERPVYKGWTQRETPPPPQHDRSPRLSDANMAPTEREPVRPDPELIEVWPITPALQEKHPLIARAWRRFVGKPERTREQED